jgi:hypothetical protein
MVITESQVAGQGFEDIGTVGPVLLDAIASLTPSTKTFETARSLKADNKCSTKIAIEPTSLTELRR